MLDRALGDLRSGEETDSLRYSVKCLRGKVVNFELMVNDVGGGYLYRQDNPPAKIVKFMLRNATGVVRKSTIKFAVLLLTMKTNYYKFHRKF